MYVEYKTSDPDISPKAINCILDAASSILDYGEDGEPTNWALEAGVAIALAALLSSDEQPAYLILREACAGAAQSPRDLGGQL